ncbi:TPA: YiiX/YebB-like N1pC/P60 family cysteine hydrolase [Aeromonas veronii]
MPRVINKDILEIGDIILTTTTKLDSKAVRLFTNSDISHALIYVAHGSVIDSTSKGVHARNVDKLIYDDECNIYVMRSLTPLTHEQKTNMGFYLRSIIGTGYTKVGLIGTVSPIKFKNSDYQFCSRLAARAYEGIGILISDDPSHCTPDNIKNSPQLYSVKNPWIEITDDEKKEIEAYGSSLDGMHDCINKLIKKARRISPTSSIKNINDIFTTLIKKQNLDNQFSKAFIESGFLDYWEVDVKAYPWRYDKKLFNEKYREDPDGLIHHCQRVIFEHNERTFEHWYITYNTFKYLSHKYKLITFQQNAKLYNTLCSMNNKRVELAKELLNRQQLL